MSLESALEKLADAILVHAEAMKLAATHSVTVTAVADTSAVKEAIAEAKAATEKPATTEKKADKVEEKGPFFWANNKTGHFGKVETKAELDKLKKKDPEVYLIPESIYNEKVKELKAKNEAAAAAKKAEEAAEEAAKKAEEAAAAEDEDDSLIDDDPTDAVDDELHVPTADEYKAAWGRFLEIDDEEVRKDRMSWTRGLLAHFGAKKATLIEEKHWPSIYKAVVDGAAGEDLPDVSSL